MSTSLLTVVGLVAVALTFDFINGFHDAANSIATVVASPFIGLVAGLALMTATFWLFRRMVPQRVDKWFRRLQLFSAALFSLSHGTNDAQKTMGIIAGVLLTAGYISTFHIPVWVILA